MNALRMGESMFAAIAAEERAASIDEKDDIYGWFLGSWELKTYVYWAEDVSARHLTGEVHVTRALEGLAVQDIWIMSRRQDRTLDLDPKFNMYGTTLRVWDTTLRAWRITWMNPAGQHFEQQIGRRADADIVQLGTRPDGTTTRWRFTAIQPNSFHWLGESLRPDGKTWLLEGEFRARRRE
jgi:hypothetical protein